MEASLDHIRTFLYREVQVGPLSRVLHFKLYPII